MSLLAPDKRILLTDRFRPDPGYRLDHALITSFTLELTTLMEIPVALTFQEWDETDPGDGLTRIGILDAIQRHIGSLTVVSQAGYVSGPNKGHPLLPLLEPAVHTVPMPRHRTFHPKATLLRYTPTPDLEDKGETAVRYRLIVSSRNLAPSQAWDTIVVLDGVLADRKTRFAPGLDRFVDGVTELADSSLDGLDSVRRSKLAQMKAEASNIEFELPPGIEEMTILPLGFDAKMRLDPKRATPEGYDRLIVSPFLSPCQAGDDTILTRYAGPTTTLVSRQEELDRLPAEVLDSYGEVMVLSDVTQTAFDDAAEPDGGETVDDYRHGLHAKLLIENHGWKSRILIGSANLTERAWSSNIELSLELTAWKSESGVEKVLGSSSNEGLRKYLEPYRRSESEEELENPDLQRAERNLERAAVLLTEARPTLDFPDTDDGTRDLKLTLSGSLDPLPDGVEVQMRPVTLDRERLATLEPDSDPAAIWDEVPIPFITSLLDVEISAITGDEMASRRFVIKVKLGSPLPEDRDRQIVRRLIENTDHLMSYIAMLLAGVGDGPGDGGLLGEPPSSGNRLNQQDGQTGPTVFPLLEKMIQAVDRDPTAIDRVAAIVKELRADEQDGKLLPEGFETVWDPIVTARKRRDEVGLD